MGRYSTGTIPTGQLMKKLNTNEFDSSKLNIIIGPLKKQKSLTIKRLSGLFVPGVGLEPTRP
jgi:hypothetical protein